MKQSISLLCLIGCVAICAYSSDTEKNQQTLELANDEGSRSLDLTAVYTDKALHAISQGLRDTAQQLEHAADENEYFFKNLWKNTKKVLKEAGKVIGNTAKEVGKAVGKTAKVVIKSKAADLTKKFLKKKLGVSGEENDTHEEAEEN